MRSFSVYGQIAKVNFLFRQLVPYVEVFEFVTHVIALPEFVYQLRVDRFFYFFRKDKRKNHFPAEQNGYFVCYINVFFIVLDIRLIETRSRLVKVGGGTTEASVDLMNALRASVYPKTDAFFYHYLAF